MSQSRSGEHETLNVVFTLDQLNELRFIAQRMSHQTGKRYGAGTLVREIVEGWLYDHSPSYRELEWEDD